MNIIRIGKNRKGAVVAGQSDKSQSFTKDAGPLLIIQPLVGIGDMIWHKPWIDELIAQNDVILATKQSAQPQILFADRLAKMTILPIMRKIRGKKGRHDGLLGLFRLAQDFKRTGAKRALVLHHSKTYLYALKLAGITQVSAFGFGDDKGLSSRVLDRADKDIHAIERMEKFWRINDWPAPKAGWRIGVSDAHCQAVRHALAQDGIVVDNLLVLGIGAMDVQRCWPNERFAELIMELRQERPDLTLAIMGGPAERGAADQIQTYLGEHNGDKVYEIFGTLDDAAAILTIAKGYVGNDTGLLNIAAVQGIASLGLFSQSPPLTYVSTLFHLDVITEEEYGTPDIIKKIAVDDVLAGITAIWPND